jgi:hypothetical protein
MSPWRYSPSGKDRGPSPEYSAGDFRAFMVTMRNGKIITRANTVSPASTR